MIERLLQRIFDLLVLLVVLAFALGVMVGFVREGIRAFAAAVSHVLVPALGVVAGIVVIGLLAAACFVGVQFWRNARRDHGGRRRRSVGHRDRTDLSEVRQ